MTALTMRSLAWVEGSSRQSGLGVVGIRGRVFAYKRTSSIQVKVDDWEKIS